MMVIFGTFVLLIFIYSLFARRLEEGVFTSPIILTSAGVVLGLTLPRLSTQFIAHETVLLVAEIALVLLLFTEASKVGLRSVEKALSLPTRLLGIALPLTILLGAGLAALLLPDLTSFWEAAILAVILAPTDAGLGQAIVENKRVPSVIRRALNVEAGLNDGLSIPFLMLFMALAVFENPLQTGSFLQFMGEQVGFGLLVGLAIGYAGGWMLMQAKKREWASPTLAQLSLPALAILAWLTADMIGGNGFIAAFIAGLTVRVTYKNAKDDAIEFSAALGQLLNLAVFFLFGIIVTGQFHHITPILVLYAILSLTVIRLLPVAISMRGTGVSRATVLFMGWFGPRGLASIVLVMVFLEQHATFPGEALIETAVFLTVLLSIYAHGFSALPGINWYTRQLAALNPSAPELKGQMGE